MKIKFLKIMKNNKKKYLKYQNNFLNNTFLSSNEYILKNF